MCGLVGIFDTRGRRDVDPALLERMNQVQLHRGPDEGGAHREPGLGLGHRRLSIIDLASGQQPLYNDDKSVVIVYNGEIYNFLDLRAELEALGHRFQTSSDTEVVVRAWEAWGEQSVRRLRGMFSYAVWDAGKQTLFLARDRLGIKPLYYALLGDGTFIFGSELKALMVHPDLSKATDPRAVEDYFAYGYIPDPKTILEQASKLPPGHTLTLRRGAQMPQPVEYWDVPFESVGPINERDAQSELVERLREAVKIRLVAEVPLGAFLSGGVDSSSVVAMMSGLSNQTVSTCSISFGDREYNEAQYAEQIAQRYQTDHRVQEVDPNDFSLIDKLIDVYDEPYADSSALPTYRLCELARQKVTVALSGDGGDENFAGYRRHRWHMYEEYVRSVVPGPIRRPLFGALGRLYPKADWAPKIFRAKATLQGCARDSLEGYLHSVGIVPDDFRERLFSPRLHSDLQGYRAIEVFKEHARRAPTDDALSLVQYLDFKTYLPADILTKVDRASMAHSLEVRVPLLDHELVEWISGLPSQMKLRRREGKYVFKKALEKHLPAEILYRPKMGFGVPLARWFRRELRDRVRKSVLDSTLSESGLFEQRFLERLVDEHQSGLRDHSSSLWSLLMFEAYQRRLNGELRLER